jgi:hypothetical protein
MNLFFLSPRRVDFFIRRGLWMCLAGILLMALAVLRLGDIGFVSGLMLLLFGGSAWGFQNWLRERGLWMLAILALCAWAPLYAIMQYDAIKHELAGARPRLVWLGWDTAVAASIVFFHVRFLATVARINRALFAPGNRPQSLTGPQDGR